MNQLNLNDYPKFINEWRALRVEYGVSGATNFLYKYGLTSIKYTLDTKACVQYWELNDKDFSWFIMRWG